MQLKAAQSLECARRIMGKVEAGVDMVPLLYKGSQVRELRDRAGYNGGMSNAVEVIEFAPEALSSYRKLFHKLMGTRLRNRREELGMTQRELAEKLGVSREALAQYETGRNGIDSGDLPRLSVVLQLPLLSFYEDTGLYIELPRMPTERRDEPREEAMSKAFQALNYEDQDVVFSVARALVQARKTAKATLGSFEEQAKITRSEQA